MRARIEVRPATMADVAPIAANIREADRREGNRQRLGYHPMGDD